MQHTLRFSSLAAAFFVAVLAVLLPHQAHAATVTINITDDQFTPQTVTVNPGDTVTWVNHGSDQHTVTADGGAFDSGTLSPGQQFSAIFNQPGTYAYHCKFHGGVGGVGMSGTITVTGNAQTYVGTQSASYVNPNANYYASVPSGYTTTYPTGTTAAGSSVNVAQLTAQVQSLLAQITALQAAGGTTGTAGAVNSSSCPLIGRVLKYGSSGDDVTRLQQFLALDPTVYPEGTVSGHYGALTQAAVQRWQTKYNIVSSGTADSTGFGVVGPRTAAAISLLCSTGGGTTGGTTTSSPSVGGYIQVTPLSGTAPLTVSVRATVNTTTTCGGATYTLDYGDSTVPQQIPVPTGTCGQIIQTFQHIYPVAGTFNLTLSANGHSTNATVTVTGSTVVTTATSTPQNPVGTISTFTTSGNAPFNANFYVSCASGVAYNVVFGDGTDLGGTGVTGTKCGPGGLDSVAHTYQNAGTFTAQLVIFAQQTNGTITPNNANAVTINVGSVSANYTYNPPQLSNLGSSTSTVFTLQFDVPTACTGYDLSWGDGSTHVTHGDGGTSCPQTTTIVTATHTYAQTGAYTITLKRGATLTKIDTIAVTIQ